jgi:hypothetical protein
MPYLSEYPITKKGNLNIDNSISGEWDIRTDEGDFKIFIEPLNSKEFIGTYYRVNKHGGKLTNLNSGIAFISEINNVQYVNIRILYGDSIFKNNYVFYKFNIISNDSIRLFYLPGVSYDKTFESSKEFKKYIVNNQKEFDSYFFPVGIAVRNQNNSGEESITSILIGMDFLGPILYPDEVVDAFHANKESIYDAKKYFEAIVPDSFNVYIEYTDNNKIDFQVFQTKGIATSNIIQVWDADMYSDEITNVTDVLGWNNYEMIVLREILHNANCISIENKKEMIQIGYQRSGMGKYDFNIYDNPILTEDIKYYNDSCRYLYINKFNVVEFGGGAIGSQCMPERENNSFYKEE